MKGDNTILSVFTAVALAVASSQGASDVTRTCECRPRGGLPNALAKLTAGETVRIAYLGGSITEADGWRPMTLAWFRSAFPQAKVEEIDASISGTGSDFGAIRLQTDVLAKKPDLLFVEFRVNGSAGYDCQSTEGIVRQTFAADPKTDICFVHTLCEVQLKELTAGRQTPFGQALERVCDHYGIPSIDFAPEIVRRMEDQSSFVFKPPRQVLAAEAIQMDWRAKGTAPEPGAGRIVFAKDGVHPGKDGHRIYCDVVARSMTGLVFPASGEVRPHVMPPRLSKNAWIATETLPATNVLTGAAWTVISDGRKDPVYGDTFRRTDRMLRGGVWTTQMGTAFRIRWVGNTLGFSDIPQAKAGEPPIEIEIVVDGGKPLVYRRARTPETRIYSRFVYLPEQAWGEHEAVFTVRRVPPGQRCIFGQFLIVGSSLPLSTATCKMQNKETLL